MRCERERERERESEKECRMTWTSVDAGIMTWRCLEEKKKISLFQLLIYTGRKPARARKIQM